MLNSNPSSRGLRRIRRAAVALAVFIFTLAVGNAFVPAPLRVTGSMIGHDFLAFYTAGTFVAEGRSHDLYDLAKVKAFQHELAAREGLDLGASFGPFWNPPFYAWVFAPLAQLRYPAALAVWEGINAIALAAALCLLAWVYQNAIRKSQSESAALAPRDRLLIPLLAIFSMPAILAITHGQNTMFSLLLLSGSVALWQAGYRMWAGVIAGLLFYKPQLGAIFAAALILVAGRRALLGLAITGLWLAAINLLTLPGTVRDYATQLPANLRQFQVEQAYLWDRHVTLRSFWRLLVQGSNPGEMWLVAKALWLCSWTALAAGLGLSWLSLRSAGNRHLRSIRRDWFVAAAILAMPLLMPFYFDYDLLLITVAAVLSLCAAMKESRGPVEENELDPQTVTDRADTPRPAFRALLLVWCCLYAAIYFNSPLARATRVSLTVMLLAAAATITMARSIRQPPALHAAAKSRAAGRNALAAIA